MPIRQLITTNKGGERDPYLPKIYTWDWEDRPKWAKKIVSTVFYATMAFAVPMIMVYAAAAIFRAL